MDIVGGIQTRLHSTGGPVLAWKLTLSWTPSMSTRGSCKKPVPERRKNSQMFMIGELCVCCVCVLSVLCVSVCECVCVRVVCGWVGMRV